MNTAKPCLFCKGRGFCGQDPCPLLPRFRIAPEIQKRVSTEFFGPNYNVFVGRIGYPRVGIGPLAAMEKKDGIDSPSSWFGMEYSRIVEMRSMMIRSRQNENIFSRSRFIQENQELAMASRPTDIEMKFKSKPVYRVSFSDVNQPMGPTATLQKLRIAENVKIRPAVEKVVRDELKAREAGNLLYRKGLDVYKITSILSSGALGMGERKKLVPTRWSITATDDMVGKELMEKIRTYPSINEFLVFEARYLDNHFVIMLMPGSWEFENFEAWAPGSTWSRGMKDTQVIGEYEPFRGRTEYADKQAGGYYAARIAVCEYLESIKRQARAFSIREIYEGYTIPLGVWVVRETARNAFRNPGSRFPNRKEALDHMGSRLKLGIRGYTSKSVIMRQKRLWDF